MTPTIAAESIIFGAILIVVALSEIVSCLHRRRVSAAIYLQHYNDLVDREME